MNVTHLECSLTGERYEAGQIHNLSRAGKPLLVRYDLDAAKRTLTRESLAGREAGMWKWREILPHDGDPVSLGEPETPIVSLPNVAAREGAAELLVKDEGRLPTGSFKARGLAMAVTMAKQFGVERIAMPTNGNAGAALAAYGARAGIETVVICPSETPEINVTETAAYGARVYVADGQIDECGALVGKGAAQGLWFDFSTLKEPYRIEGKKTMGYEVAEQMGWELPDAIFYPTGGGVGMIGMWKAFDEMQKLGWIGSRRPKMIAVQAEGCQPVVRAYDAGEARSTFYENAHTVAAGLRVPKPLGDFLVLNAVRESGGTAIAITDEDMINAGVQLASDEGIYAAPEGAACVAAAQKLIESGFLNRSDRIVLYNTGSGLKYPEAYSTRFPRTASTEQDKLGGLITPR